MRIKFQPKQFDFGFEISLLAYFLFVFVVYQLPPKIEPYIVQGNSFDYRCFYDLALYPLYYVLLNLLISIVLRRHIVFRAIIAVILGIMLSIAEFFQTPGIIDPVYFFVLSTSFACVLGVYKGACFSEMLEDINEFNAITEKLIDYIRDGYKYILGKAFQGWLGLGASLGVSMSILFKNGYEDPHLKFMALKMLIGFIFISIAVGLWVGIPMLNGIVGLQEHMNSLTNSEASKVKNPNETNSADAKGYTAD